MTVAHDASSEGGPILVGTSPTTFLHTPSGTPKGVVVFIQRFDTTVSDYITGVTYGGIAMARFEYAVSTAGGEDGDAYGYFLGASIPTGAQTVSVAHDGSGDYSLGRIYCVTVTASGDTQVGDSGSVTGQAYPADPQVALTTTPNSLRYCGITSGRDDVADLTLLADMSTVLSNDFGTAVHRVDRQTTESSGLFTVGYTANADEAAMTAVAIEEIAAGDPVNRTNIIFVAAD